MLVAVVVEIIRVVVLLMVVTEALVEVRVGLHHRLVDVAELT